METVERAGRRVGAAGLLVLCLATAGVGLATSGCRVNENDIHRWETTAHGPDKLRAVLFHDKYDNSLRIEAATSLIRMKPRQGRRVGIGIMVETLATMAPEARQSIVAALVPSIIAELRKPPPVAPPGQPRPMDASFPYKDAAYAMLTSDRTVIIADEALKEGLKAALIDWAMADFEHRLEDRSQAYGMEQLLRFIGPPAVAGLPKLMTREAKRLDQMASLVAEYGDPQAKEAASANLVAIARFVTSSEWVDAKKPELQAANAASKITPTEKQFEAQLAQYQEEELFRVYGSMKKLGGRPSVDFLLGFAADKNQPEKRRQAALAALEGRLDRNNPSDIQRILEIATADAPDAVLDQAFRRVGEMPRELVVEKLYGLFKTDKWKIRRAAAATILKMSTVKHIDEFMSRLPDSKGFAMPEALTYGASFGDLKEGSPLEALKKHFTEGPAPVRTSAIAYYFTFGTAADLAAVKALEGDTTRAPVCDADPDCKWACEVQKEGSNERELRDVKTVGEFVQYCIEPAMQERKPELEKGEKK
ncbi:hypothetical protein BE04_37270 [Sorangium cellulosum]|uniref:HEAT repeat domain-containing protein n=1 Tax=Sorangium cellulosum TaxID=56 RepID=A0A150TXQ6_SORCE|nr:hypothetical protein [Sorangium cellulosum]KYF58488.1 hypothetical protein BE04_37270 [Sorangium cellulosum]KYG09460.1 hypothetical protein BE21_17785 [Sorangium cellulosum]